MNKTIATLFASVIGLGLFASPVKGRLASDGVDYESRVEPQNTDYIQVNPSFAGKAAWQKTGVYVGYGTDFSVGARVVIDISVIEDWSTSVILAAANQGGGYSWLQLYKSEYLDIGRHQIEFVNQDSAGIYYNTVIDGRYSVNTYTTYWQYNNKSYEFLVFNGVSAWGNLFRGLYHGIKLYDSSGNLRHSWVPDPSGRFYDEIEGVLVPSISGSFIYGDLANE